MPHVAGRYCIGQCRFRETDIWINKTVVILKTSMIGKKTMKIFKKSLCFKKYARLNNKLNRLKNGI